MWLQHKIYGFALLDGSKLSVQDILSCTLVLNDKPTDIPLSRLIKHSYSTTPSSINGYSILEYFNENGDIEIDEVIYNIKFLDPKGTQFKLVGFKETGFIRKDREFTEKEMDEISTLIKSSIEPEEKAPSVDSVSNAATAEDATTEATAKADEPVVDGAVIYENLEYEDDKKDLEERGYVEFKTNPPSNFYLLIRGKRRILAEIVKDDYHQLEEKVYKIKIDQKTKTFSIEKKLEYQDA